MTDTHTTAHIPDEAVRAAQIKFAEVSDYHATSKDMRDAISAALPHLSAPCAVKVPTKEERHANTSRNLIINQTSTDLEQIINGHDPEQSILNNDVWDRLDKMACEIEALAKPVDVAAVREHGFREGLEAAAKWHEEHAAGYKTEHSNLNISAELAAEHIGSATAIRALSAEPAQDEQLPQDVINLVIAGRELVYSGEVAVGSHEAKALDKALEAFASRIPWENEPDEIAAATSEAGK